MKKIIGLFALSALMLASCNGSDDSENLNPGTMLVKKMVLTDADGSLTTTISYNGQKIVSTTDSDGYHTMITYTGDLITKWEDFDADDVLAERETFEYNAAGQLVKYTDADLEQDYVSVYSYQHHADGSISYSASYGNADQQTFSHDGTITATQFTEHHAAMGVTYTKTFTYDNKNNPFKNVTGYDKIYFSESDEALNFNNNVISNVDSQDPDHPTTTTYTYNSADFPVTASELELGSELNTMQYTYQ